MDLSILDILGFLTVPLLVGLNGFFVAAEFSLVTIRRTRVEQLVQENRFGALAVHEAVSSLDDAIAATQLGITFASLGLGWVGEPALAHAFQPWFEGLGSVWGTAASHALAVAVAFLIITYLHVVLGELAPKAIALQRAEQMALVVAGPLLMFGRLFRPFISFMNGSGNLVVRLMRLPPLPAHARVHSVDEISMLLEETEEAGMIPEDEADYVQNVFELSDKKVKDVMVPRDTVVTISMHANPDDVLQVARETAHTRMPVWEGSPENIVGIVNTKDLFHLFSLKGVVILMDAMYPALVIDPNQPVARLLRMFKREKRQMAVVKDWTGKFLGIVTLEDIIEEIVGEIEDEHDVGPLQGGRSPQMRTQPQRQAAPQGPAKPAPPRPTLSGGKPPPDRG